MLPQEFKKLWELDTIEPIAMMLNKSKDIAYKWTTTGNSHRPAPQDVLQLLDFVSMLWESWEDERLRYPPHYRFFYEQNTTRRTPEMNEKYAERIRTSLLKRPRSNGSVLNEFIETWDEKAETIALLLPDQSVDAVRSWFSDTPTQPPIEVIQLMNVIHVLWWKWERERLFLPPHFRSLYMQNVADRIVKSQSV